MAYLNPGTLTCPDCGLRGQVTWIVGVGPGAKPGNGPAYVTLRDPGPFTEIRKGRTTQVKCPHDGTILATRTPKGTGT